MKIRPLAIASPIFLSLISLSLAQAAPQPTTQAQQTARLQTARLAGLCRVWGVVKYFHPSLAYQPINWDQALVEAIPKVRAAKTAAQYADAVESMLAVLHDSNTHIVRPSLVLPKRAAPNGSRQPEAKILPDGTAVITATDYRQFTDYAEIGTMAQTLQRVQSASALVFDLRRRNGDAPGDSDYGAFILSQALISNIPGLLAHNLALPVSRHRMHLGYTPADGDDHGGYYSAFVTSQARFLPARSDASVKPKPMAFIVSPDSADIHDILGGLQAAHLAAVIEEETGTADQKAEEAGVDTQLVSLPGGVQAVVRLSETVNPNGTLGFHPDISVRQSEAAGNDPAMIAALHAVQTSTAPALTQAAAPSLYSAALPDSNYADMAFPSTEYRLLSLFRFWNIIRYVYPYKNVIGRSWEDVLTEYIPQMEGDKDAHAYGITAAKMIAEIHDSHGFASIPALGIDGHWMPPVALREVQGRTMISALPTPRATPGLHLGDLVTAVDAEPVASRRARLGRLHAASTPQSLSDTVSAVLLIGRKNVPAVLTVQTVSGQTHTVRLPRTVRYVVPSPRTTAVYGVLPSGLGYIDLGRLTPQEVDTAFAAVAKTRGLIFDMRGYPNGTAWAIAPYLASHPVIGTRFEVPEPQSPDDTSVSRSNALIVPNPRHHYGGRVVVLIDESAISQAEHTCLFLEAACHPAFIGTPTAGANGEVTNAVLPGGISFSFTGMSVLHGDGRQLQRLGIQPTLRVAPTLAGLRAGRDEVLEAAIKYLLLHK